MKIIKRYALAAALAVPVAALAHGGGQHFMGTVKAVDEKGLTLQTKDKKEVRILFGEKTKFEKDGSASSAKELAAGERVVVHTGKKEGKSDPLAVLVKFGAVPPKGPKAAPKHAPGSPGK